MARFDPSYDMGAVAKARREYLADLTAGGAALLADMETRKRAVEQAYLRLRISGVSPDEAFDLVHAELSGGRYMNLTIESYDSEPGDTLEELCEKFGVK